MGEGTSAQGTTNELGTLIGAIVAQGLQLLLATLAEKEEESHCLLLQEQDINSLRINFDDGTVVTVSADGTAEIES